MVFEGASIPLINTFEGASAQGEVSWVTPGVTSRGAIQRTAPGAKLCLNIAFRNHRTTNHGGGGRAGRDQAPRSRRP